ncbi:hypothetical protein SAMN05216532_3190 [Streptomyces sp. 2231.1]|uniref:hypothetical protein n=1 Tax=Streptomyces sp. 2231.1 TaxID=1855347 RepID=UPI0008987A3F|nr:hypothetical protein [Streptomyces sp. 2231.1]SED03173.1 hypothetical protein SAMN05216532_3190 [Streptomyces sp. 2231.1]
MPQHTCPPICRDCDGFSTVAITTGTRNTDGTRATLSLDCRACKGTGRQLPAAQLVRAGR